MKKYIKRTCICIGLIYIFLLSQSVLAADNMIETDMYTIKENKYICDILPDTTVKQIKENVKTVDNIKDINGNGLYNEKIVGTGMTLIDAGQNQYTLSICGDLSGEGKITATDLLLIKKEIVGKISLNKEKLYAADINNDNKITATDLLLLKQKIIGISGYEPSLREIKLQESLIIDLSQNSKDKLEVKGTPGTAKMQIEWMSSNPNVVKVEQDGTVIGIKNGIAVITARSQNKQTTICKITVQTTPTKVTLNSTNKTIDLSENKQINLITSVYPENANASNKITFTSDNSEIATVNENGTVTAVKNGETTIKATTQNNKIATCTIKVQTSPTEIVLNTTKAILNMVNKKEFQIVPTIKPDTANVNKEITYVSSNEGVVTVNSSGKITAISEGTATITAKTENNKTSSMQVEVEAKIDDFVVELETGYESLLETLETGNQQISMFYKNEIMYQGLYKKPSKLQLTIKTTDGKVIEGATYESSNVKVFSVSESGELNTVVTASTEKTTTVRQVSATLTIEYGGIVKEIKVKIGCAIAGRACDRGGWQNGVTTNKGAGHFQQCQTCHQCHRFHTLQTGSNVSQVQTDEKFVHCSLCGGYIDGRNKD